jgi:hypothetical protein
MHMRYRRFMQLVVGTKVVPAKSYAIERVMQLVIHAIRQSRLYIDWAELYIYHCTRRVRVASRQCDCVVLVMLISTYRRTSVQPTADVGSIHIKLN